MKPWIPITKSESYSIQSEIFKEENEGNPIIQLIYCSVLIVSVQYHESIEFENFKAQNEEYLNIWRTFRSKSYRTSRNFQIINVKKSMKILLCHYLLFERKVKDSIATDNEKNKIDASKDK